jgi:hypothetical protein
MGRGEQDAHSLRWLGMTERGTGRYGCPPKSGNYSLRFYLLPWTPISLNWVTGTLTLTLTFCNLYPK